MSVPIIGSAKADPAAGARFNTDFSYILNGRPMGRRVLIKRIAKKEEITAAGIITKVNEELAGKIVVEIRQVGPDCTAITEKDIGKRCIIFNIGAEMYSEFGGEGPSYGEIGETEILRLLNS